MARNTGKRGQRRYRHTHPETPRGERLRVLNARLAKYLGKRSAQLSRRYAGVGKGGLERDRPAGQSCSDQAE